MTPSTRLSSPQLRVDRVARTSARVAIVVVLAALGVLVSVAAAHAGPARAATTAGAGHTAAPAHPVVGSFVSGSWSSVVVQVVLWSIVVGLVVTRRRRTSTQPLEEPLDAHCPSADRSGPIPSEF